MLRLEALRPCWSEPGAYAVLEHDVVTALSGEAARAGVRPGMRGGGVSAVAPATRLLARDPDQEQRCLGAIAMALLQYSPEVAHADHACLVLDVSASLRLFKGPRALCRLVRRSVGALGFSAQLGVAPTAHGAWLLAKNGRRPRALLRRRTLSLPSLAARLDALPCHLLAAAAPHQVWLAGIGANDIGALRRLPRAGLQRRTSAALLAELDRAYGHSAEMFEWIKVPLQFSERIETFDRVERADALLHGAAHLLCQLVGWLNARQRAVRRFVLLLEHERGRDAIAPTVLEIVLAEPAWQESHLLRLLKERLAKLALCAPVIALRLEARQVEPMLPANASLFPEPGGSVQDYHRLLELLTARLGPDNVLSPAMAQDYRPEVCNAWQPVHQRRARADGEPILSGRPFWLLPKPIALLVRAERPFYGSALKLVSGPERLEAGWWDEQSAARDYYVGQGADGACYWIYLERARDARWYLHGLYA